VHTFYIKEGFKQKPFKKRKVLHAYLGEYEWCFTRYNNSSFLSYCWTAIVHAETGACLVCIQEDYDALDRKTKKRLRKWQSRIEAIFEPYNVSIEWGFTLSDSVSPYVDHVDKFIPILNQLLKQPELFVSMVLCSESFYVTGNDNDEMDVQAIMDHYKPINGDYKVFCKSN
jgi:hypothetical protein